MLAIGNGRLALGATARDHAATGHSLSGSDIAFKDEQFMSRDVTKLRVFATADELLMQIYRATSTLPTDERFGLQAQLRRAALSVPVNIVEGSARRTLREYVNFLNMASASSAEVAYLLTVAGRLGFIERAKAMELENRPSPAVRRSNCRTA
jgi:four helix bundle protein